MNDNVAPDDMHDHLIRQVSERWEAAIMTEPGEDGDTTYVGSSTSSEFRTREEALAWVQSEPHLPMTGDQYVDMSESLASGREYDQAHATRDLLYGHHAALEALAAKVQDAACQSLLDKVIKQSWAICWEADALVAEESDGDKLRSEFKDAGFTTDFDDEPWSPEAAAWIEHWVKHNM